MISCAVNDEQKRHADPDKASPAGASNDKAIAEKPHNNL